MGFLDKVKAQAEQTIKQGQEKIDEVQAKKKADGLLRDLGAWYYAAHTERDGGQGEAEMARITAELKAHEAEHGPLGGDDRDERDEPTPPPPAAEQVPPAPTPGTPAPPPPPPAGEPPAPLPPAGSAPMPAAPPMPPPSTTELP